MLRQFWLLNGCRVKNADIFCGLDKNHKITEIIENIPLKEYNIITIPSLTVAEIKNRCIPCVYWGTAIFVVVMKYSNLFFSFAFFLDRSHFAFGYELIISSEAAGFMKIICNGFTLI